MLHRLALRLRALADVADTCAGHAEQIANDKTRHRLVSDAALRVCHGFDRLDHLGRRVAFMVGIVDTWIDFLTGAP